jgi:hypothetical protein
MLLTCLDRRMGRFLARWMNCYGKSFRFKDVWVGEHSRSLGIISKGWDILVREAYMSIEVRG